MMKLLGVFDIYPLWDEVDTTGEKAQQINIVIGLMGLVSAFWSFSITATSKLNLLFLNKVIHTTSGIQEALANFPITSLLSLIIIWISYCLIIKRNSGFCMFCFCDEMRELKDMLEMSLYQHKVEKMMIKGEEHEITPPVWTIREYMLVYVLFTFFFGYLMGIIYFVLYYFPILILYVISLPVFLVVLELPLAMLFSILFAQGLVMVGIFKRILKGEERPDSDPPLDIISVSHQYK